MFLWSWINHNQRVQCWFSKVRWSCDVVLIQMTVQQTVAGMADNSRNARVTTSTGVRSQPGDLHTTWRGGCVLTAAAVTEQRVCKCAHRYGSAGSERAQAEAGVGREPSSRRWRCHQQDGGQSPALQASSRWSPRLFTSCVSVFRVGRASRPLRLRRLLLPLLLLPRLHPPPPLRLPQSSPWTPPHLQPPLHLQLLLLLSLRDQLHNQDPSETNSLSVVQNLQLLYRSSLSWTRSNKTWGRCVFCPNRFVVRLFPFGPAVTPVQPSWQRCCPSCGEWRRGCSRSFRELTPSWRRPPPLNTTTTR